MLPVRAVLASVVLIVVLAPPASLGPVAVTRRRLEGSISSTFNNLTVLQQRKLGRPVPRGARLQTPDSLRPALWQESRTWRRLDLHDDGHHPTARVRTVPDHRRHIRRKRQSDGCYKAEAPPSFVGQQMMTSRTGAACKPALRPLRLLRHVLRIGAVAGRQVGGALWRWRLRFEVLGKGEAGLALSGRARSTTLPGLCGSDNPEIGAQRGPAANIGKFPPGGGGDLARFGGFAGIGGGMAGERRSSAGPDRSGRIICHFMTIPSLRER